MVENIEDEIIPTQFIKKGFDLSDKVDKDFLKKIEDVFGSNVSVISLAVLIDTSEEESSKEIISFNYRNDKEQKNKELFVDFSNHNSFEKIKKIL